MADVTIDVTMSEQNALYLLQNQDKLFLSKSKEWVDATDLNVLYRSRHKDEAVNQLVEINSRDIDQRIRCLACEVDARGQPVIDPQIMPDPLPKPEPMDDTAAEDGVTAAEATAQDPTEKQANEAVEAAQVQLALAE